LKLLPPVLDGDDQKATALNVKSLRGLTFRDGVAYLVDLANHGLVAFRRNGGSEILAPSTVLPLLASPDGKKKISFELTDEGGRAWESAASPRWHHMADGSAVLGSEEGNSCGWDWTWFSQDRERLMSVLGWYPMLQREQIDISTINWEVHSEYQVKYWKRLSNVHVVTFRSWPAGDSMPAWPLGFEPPWFRDWRISHGDWCREPWEVGEWPPLL
jgi:hypothetical protein